MKKLNWSLAKLLITLTIFFNIERVDFNQNHINNGIDIHSFDYILGVSAVLAIIFWPVLAQWSFSRLAALWLMFFLIFKLFGLVERPFLGNLYTYLTLTEGSFILLLVYQAHQVALAHRAIFELAEYITLAEAGVHLPTLDEASSKIRREMTRSRYYHRPLSVLVLRPEKLSLVEAIPQMMEEIQNTIAERCLTVKLAHVIGEELRVVDTILEDRENSRFVVLCPEIDGYGTNLLAEHIRQMVQNRLGLTLQYGLASFPDEAITFDSLVTEATNKLKTVQEEPVLDRSRPVAVEALRAMGD